MKVLLALFFLLAPLAAHGQLLKCVSSDGRVEYASQCPPGAKEMQTGIKSSREGPSGGGAAAPQQKTLAEREAEFRKRQTEGAEAGQKAEAKAAEDARRRETCDRAQAYLKSLQEGQRLAKLDPKTGERVFIEDPDRPAEIARAQASVGANCK